MTDFYDELFEGDVHIRDKFQIELKSEYPAKLEKAKITYLLDFYFFIPNSLQISKETYSKQQFYYDETNLIRLKTPGFSLSELADPDNLKSPLAHVRLSYQREERIEEATVTEELKLYANIVRSALRERARGLLEELKQVREGGSSAEETGAQIIQFCQQLASLRTLYIEWQEALQPHWQQGKLTEYSQYIDEFVSNIAERYLAGLLQEVTAQHLTALAPAEEALIKSIARETNHRAQRKERSPFAEDPDKHWEYAVYRGGLLKKFVFEALFLTLTRDEPAQTFQHITAALAASLAMLFYLYFLSFHSLNPVLDSTAFVILSVVLYAAKDRLKEGLKNLSTKWVAGWFPDYRTTIRIPNKDLVLGYLKEYFSFLSSDKVPADIAEIRNTHFHTELEQAKRLESVIHFRKEVILIPHLEHHKERAYDLNDIFRYNISRFLLKASDPYKEQLIYDPFSKQVQVVKVPKVYHINIILRKKTEGEQVRYQNYRVVVDKEGIKRIEKVR